MVNMKNNSFLVSYQWLARLLLAALLIIFILTVCGKAMVSAQAETPNPSSSSSGGTAEIPLDSDCNDPDKECKIMDMLKKGINFLSAAAGIVFVFSIMWAGYQYMTARDNTQAVGAAKNRIVMTIIAMLFFLFTYAILNWLIPGGLL